eukprot:5144947-Amphidinium_carterae.1
MSHRTIMTQQGGKPGNWGKPSRRNQTGQLHGQTRKNAAGTYLWLLQLWQSFHLLFLQARQGDAKINKAGGPSSKSGGPASEAGGLPRKSGTNFQGKGYGQRRTTQAHARALGCKGKSARWHRRCSFGQCSRKFGAPT